MQTEELNKLNETLASSAIANEIALHYLEELKQYPGLYQKELKKYGNLYQNQLLKVEKTQFDVADKEASDEVDVTSSEYFDRVKYISQGNIFDLATSIMLNEAYRLDPDSITGIAKKILKNSKK